MRGGVIPPGAFPAPAAASNAMGKPEPVLGPELVRALGAAPSAGLMTAVRSVMQPQPAVPRSLVFVDTETTSLRADRRAWEIAMVRRAPSGAETRWLGQVFGADCRLSNADARALEVGGFYDRHEEYRSGATFPVQARFSWTGYAGGIGPVSTVAREVERFTRGCTLVGANVAFDAETLSDLLRGHGLAAAWHYRLVDVEALAAGHLHAPLRSLASTAEALGLTVDPATQHTALGDALLARDIYDAVYAAGPS